MTPRTATALPAVMDAGARRGAHAATLLAGARAAVVGYALGSIPVGYLVVRWRTGEDIRALGSGSTGGRNVGRRLGLSWGFASGAGDAAKGAAAVLVARDVAAGGWHAAIPAVVAGHAWSPAIGFRGGRGIAPALGAVMVADPRVGASVVGSFLGAMAITRRTRPAIAISLGAAPLCAVALRRPPATVLAIVATVALVVAAHVPGRRGLVQGDRR